MTEFPYMPLAVDAYIGDTTHLTLQEHGAYLRLLMIAWRMRGEPKLPNDDKMLARYLGVDPRTWSKLKPVIMPFWTAGDDGFLRQKKQIEVRHDSRKRVEGARNAANARWGDKSLENNDQPNAPAVPPQSADDATKTKLPSVEETRPNGLVSEPAVADAAKPRKRNAYSADFEASWSAYPTDANMSKLKAFTAWKRLSPDDRADVAKAIPAFLTFCRKDPTYRPVHMVRFITERRFESHLGDGRAKLATTDDWQRRLDFGRSKKSWSTAEWGPAPGLPGSLAPKETLQPGDGSGWTEWKAAG